MVLRTLKQVNSGSSTSCKESLVVLSFLNMLCQCRMVVSSQSAAECLRRTSKQVRVRLRQEAHPTRRKTLRCRISVRTSFVTTQLKSLARCQTPWTSIFRKALPRMRCTKNIWLHSAQTLRTWSCGTRQRCLHVAAHTTLG